jgi:hypothetical protein
LHDVPRNELALPFAIRDKQSPIIIILVLSRPHQCIIHQKLIFDYKIGQILTRNHVPDLELPIAEYYFLAYHTRT